MKKIKIYHLLVAFLCIDANSNTLVLDHKINYMIKSVNSACKTNFFFDLNEDIYIGSIKNKLSQLTYFEVTDKCKSSIKVLQNHLEKKLKDAKNSIEFSSGSPDLYFQDSGRRATKDNEIKLSHENFFHNFAYRISLNKPISSKDDTVRLDDTYVSMLKNNTVFTIGKTSRKWGYSKNSSLILSNAAEPSPGISIKNFNSINISDTILNLRNIEYEIFVNKLESDRFVPRPYLFGMKLSFEPIDFFKLSLFRTAQFGGKGRKLNSKIFFDMLIGRDNYGKNFDNEPGNQLAGIDVSYSLLQDKNLVIYSQIIGEDESGYLPSRTFFHVGFDYFQFNKSRLYNLEYFDTGSKKENYVYSHGVYKSGYKYKGFPIGSAFDADSRGWVANFHKNSLKGNSLKIRFISGDFNYNNNQNYFLGNSFKNLSIIEGAFKMNHFLGVKNLSSNISLHINNNKKDYKKEEIFFTLLYKW